MATRDPSTDKIEDGIPPAEHGENPSGDFVFAPASERVPVDPIPGHREFVSQVDTHTPERASAGPTPAAPSFGTYDDAAWNSEGKSRALPAGLGWVALGIGGGVGGWLFLRWRAERNKPINRIRRQALHTAAELRDRVPSPEEAVKPAAGLTTALLSLAIILYQQAQRRSQRVAKQADKSVSDLDLQKRLKTLKKRWDPSRLELEKISISRH